MKISETIFVLLLTLIAGLCGSIYINVNSKADMIGQRIDEVSVRLINMGERVRAVEVQLQYEKKGLRNEP